VKKAGKSHREARSAVFQEERRQLVVNQQAEGLIDYMESILKKVDDAQVRRAKEALQQLQLAVDEMQFFDGGPEDLEEFMSQLKPTILVNLRELDIYLTGKSELRRHDDTNFEELVKMWRTTFYLSDGGYSRLTVDLCDSTVVFDRGCATQRARNAWDALK